MSHMRHGTGTRRVEQRRAWFRPTASCVSALSSFVANSPQAIPAFPPPPLKFRTVGFPQYGEFRGTAPDDPDGASALGRFRQRNQLALNPLNPILQIGIPLLQFPNLKLSLLQPLVQPLDRR
jgi:hypothetical protein